MVTSADEERGERVATDRSLAGERDRADSEIASRSAVSDELADGVVRVAPTFAPSERARKSRSSTPRRRSVLHT